MVAHKLLLCFIILIVIYHKSLAQYAPGINPQLYQQQQQQQQVNKLVLQFSALCMRI